MKIKITPEDKKWARLVKIRDNFRCRRCGRFGKDGVGWKMESAHIMGRGHKSTKWLLENGICLCFKCHRFAHEDPLLWADWCEKNLGKVLCRRLRELSNQIYKKSRDLPKWKKYLKEKEEELTEENNNAEDF